MQISGPPGATVEWVDRETVAYVRGNERALAWVDFQKGLFSRGRVLKKSSIESWQDHSGQIIREVTDPERELIVEAIVDYYRQHRRPCEVIE
jgi:hypothetical protein